MQPSLPKHVRKDKKATNTPVGQQETFICESPGNITHIAAGASQPKRGASDGNMNKSRGALGGPAWEITNTANVIARQEEIQVQPMILRNMQNSCFALSALQTIFSIPEFRLYITTFVGSPVLQPVTTELARMFREADRLGTACRLRNQLAQSTGDERFNVGSQEDSSEFLAVLLSVVKEEVQHDETGKSIMKKFLGREKIERKFLTG